VQVSCDLFSAAAANSLPCDGTVKLLAEVLYELPDLGDALLRAVDLVPLRLGVHTACLHRALDELPDIGAVKTVSGFPLSQVGQRAVAARFYRLLALFDVGDEEAAEKKDELHRLWLRIANLLSSGTSVLDRTMVLSCLFCQKSQSMCRWFVKMLDDADLQSLISRTAATRLSSVYDHSTTASNTVPNSSFYNELMSIDNRSSGKSEENAVTDDDGFVPSAVDKSEVISNLSSSIDDDIAQMIALSSTASHRVAWYHLYLTCFERKIHFLDLFLVSNTNFCAFLTSDVHILCTVFQLNYAKIQNLVKLAVSQQYFTLASSLSISFLSPTSASSSLPFPFLVPSSFPSLLCFRSLLLPSLFPSLSISSLSHLLFPFFPLIIPSPFLSLTIFFFPLLSFPPPFLSSLSF